MNHSYVPSHMEEQISKEYIKRDILKPSDLTVSNIAERFGIEIFHYPYASFSIKRKNQHFMFLDTGLPTMQFKLLFSHELCHIIRHAGEQDRIPPSFKELQEWEAKNFIKYATIPYHMVHYVKEEDISYTAELFDVPLPLCKERLINLAGRKNYKKGSIFTHLVPALSCY
ncbi:ImmA/IrrE family metallo-endopeptidase [Priestia endophytica]|uniref:ImmA/IrrE family metallo-endopeptidase n=1 Tax=Priestia endophytica TaxID=135735 RepID=UPI00203FB482|nr:ImmA/IrrE family metallo-endopeptidase [Priestia endophytica]MCM3538456.1 ImmA/IrrE family metallo-endopeptidase [Priestia endophytica]